MAVTQKLRLLLDLAMTVNADLKMSIFAEMKCSFWAVSIVVYTALIHHFTCRLEAPSSPDLSACFRLDGRKRQV